MVAKTAKKAAKPGKAAHKPKHRVALKATHKPASAKKSSKPTKAKVVAKPVTKKKPEIKLASKPIEKPVQPATKPVIASAASAFKAAPIEALKKANGKVPPQQVLKPGVKPGEGADPNAQREDADSPLLDMSDVAVRKMVTKAKARGYVTYDELNKVLPSEKVSSE